MSKQKPEWLEDIQYRSWEPELFISGGVIFFLLQATDFLYYQSFLMLQQTGYYEPILIASLLTAALNALIFGFVIHLILRGFWVAAVTLSYVFPDGVQMNRIHYQEMYKKKVRKVLDTTDWVIMLETICSLVFTLSFFFFMIIMGLLITMMVIIPHSSLRITIGPLGYTLIWALSMSICLLALVYMFDFFTLGYLKKHKKLAKYYYPIYVVFSILTLAPLYRTTYYTLVSNIRRPWIVVAGAITYLIIAFTITQLSRSGAHAFFDPKTFLNIRSQSFEHDTRYYESERPKGDLVQQATIQSDIIDDAYIKLFIVHQKIVENLMDKNCDPNTKHGAALLDCYANFYKVFINETYQDRLTWRQYTHPDTREMGIITYIPIKALNAEEHTLKVVLNVSGQTDLKKLLNFGFEGATYAVIPFWKN